MKNAERYTSPRKEAGLVIYLAFLAKVANLHYMILTALRKYWPDIGYSCSLVDPKGPLFVTFLESTNNGSFLGHFWVH